MKSIYLLSIVCLFCFSACKKLGCTDENATNYEEISQKNDGSCTYTCTLGIWFDVNKSILHALSNVTSFTYFVDGKEVGTVSINSYLSINPSCNTPDVLVVELNLGKTKSNTYKLWVKDQAGILIENYTITVEGGKCNLFMLK